MLGCFMAIQIDRIDAQIVRMVEAKQIFKKNALPCSIYILITFVSLNSNINDKMFNHVFTLLEKI